MRLRILLGSLLALIIALPVESEHFNTMMALFGGIIPLSGGSLGARGKWVQVMAGLCVLLSAHQLSGVQLLPAWVGMAVLPLYFWMAAALVLRQVYYHRMATPELLSGALSSFLLLGLAWAAAFSLLEHFKPGSLKSPDTLDASLLFYFTFVTLLTIGYGDVLPASAAARTMAVLTGISGMVFTTVVLASLVTIQTTRNARFQMPREHADD